jgi:excinuclease UvrABC nuclease subunit
MPDIPAIFERQAEFDPSADFAGFLAQVPAKWVVYLLADADRQPVQLLCVKNLRASLKRRLGEEEPVLPTRKLNYRQLVRHVFWRRVDSAFEADWLYLEAARAVFPQTYQAMVGFRPAWFVHVNPDAPFPRYVKTTQPAQKAGLVIGPVEDKHAAQRLIELLEDAFDLCRYYNILVQAPAGKACPYKEMGRCPAPCDGSISMAEYRRMILASARAIVDPRDVLQEQERQMRQAADALQFERAARIKARIDQLSHLGRGPFRHARPLEDFAFVSLQPGPRQPTARLFLITPGQIEQLATLLDEPARWTDLLRVILGRAAESSRQSVASQAAERISLVAWHLFAPKQTHGVFLRLGAIAENSLARAYREIRSQKPAEESEGEGVIKELHAL